MRKNTYQLILEGILAIVLLAGCSGSGSKNNNNGNSCTTNTDCSTGYICQGGKCITQNNNSCTTNAQCQNGQVCQNGSCVAQNQSTIPSAPTNLTATAGNAQVTLNWNSSSGATSYNIYESTVSGGIYTKVGSTFNTNGTVTGLANGDAYYFVVTAVNTTGESGYSNQVGVILIAGKPTNLTAIAGDQQVSLTWNASTGATSYNVYYATTSGGPYTKVNSVTNAYYTITGLTNGDTYYFVITAVDAGGESGYSNQASATLLSNAPTNLSASAGNAQASLTWNASTGATSYNVYYATTSGGPYTKVNSTTNAYYTVTGLANGDAYYFVVTAVNTTGESGYSNQVGIILIAGKPTNLTAIAGDQQVSLTWSPSTGATSYNLYYATTSGGPYSKINSTTNAYYTATGLTRGTTYYFVVTAVDAGGESGYSNEASSVAYVINTYTGGFSAPAEIAIDNSGNVWVTNVSNNSVEKIPTTGGNGITYTAGFNGPWGIAIDASGNVWVTNAHDNTVTELSSTGSLIGTYSLIDSYGVSFWPINIAIDSSTNVWLTSPTNGIMKLNSTGITIGTYGFAPSPWGIAINGAGNVWVSNESNNNVTVANSSGTLIGICAVGTEPSGIAIDSSGNVWVANEGSNNVTELSSSGVPIGTYAVGTYPFAIAIDGSGNFWIVNSGSNNVTELNSSGITQGTYSVGSMPEGIAIDNSGNVWVANEGSNNVTELMNVAKGPQYWPYTGPQWP